MNTSKLRLQKRWESVYLGAVYGVMAWTVYAIVECGFSIILPTTAAYVPLHWGLTCLLFIIYPIFGLIVGGLFGLGFTVASGRIAIFQKEKFSILLPTVSTLTVVLAFDVSLIVNFSTSPFVRSLGLPELPPLSISLLMILGLGLSTSSDRMYMRLRFLTNPWTVSIMLLGLPWIANEILYLRGRIINAVAALTYTSAIFLISFFVQKILQSRRTIRSKAETLASSGKFLIFLIFAVLIAQGVIFFLKQAHPQKNAIMRSLPSSNSYPNIILITMDTVRADHLSLYGYERDTTPNLKKLSEEAMVYTRSIASGAVTLSTHASIFTGMYLKQHGAHFDPWRGYPMGRPLGEKFKTLAEILSEKGYLTMGVVANPAFLSPFYGFDQGFQYYDYRGYIPFLGQTRPYFIRHMVRNLLIRFAPREAFDMVYRRAETINREAFHLLDNVQEKGRPLFLFLNYMDAHNPYIPPSPFDTLYPGKDETFTTARYFPLAWSVIKLERKATDEEYNHLISQYDGAIAYIDFHIGNLIAKLKALGLYENSIIIITSDHGEAFGEKNLFNHGVSVYQDQIHVPLIIKYPNIRQKIVVDEVVSIVDLMPTILDVLDEDIPRDLPGKSLLKWKSGKSRAVISETYPSGNLIGHHKRFNRIEYAIISGAYKFISSTKGKKELFFLPEDPDENENIYHSNDVLSKKFEAKLEQWLESTKAEYESSIKVKPDKEMLERLRSLGYIK